MDISTAFMAVHTRAGEHHDDSRTDDTGIVTIMEELGIPAGTSMEEAIDQYGFAMLGTPDIPMAARASILGAFVAGAYWRRANERDLFVITDEMVERGAMKLASETTIPLPDDPTIREFLADAQRELSRAILTAALRPVADPPTDDGAEASS